MAVDTIRRLFLTPPVGVARLGGSTTPMAAFEWGAGDPHTVAETRIRPTWTLTVNADGSVTPQLPTRLTLRDGALIRPVAPFVEVWAMVGDGPPTNWTARPVSPQLLAANGAGPDDLTFRVTAVNLKAARRTDDPALAVGTFPAVVVRGDDHAPRPLLGTSPPTAATPMVPPGRSIPLGRVQVLRATAHVAGQPWSEAVRLDTVRLRFTPATGLFYGPPEAAQGPRPAVPAGRAFLAGDAGWLGAPASARVVPADTVDVDGQGSSLGVIDDTCDARIVAELALAAGTLRATANVTVAPPHFAPDRRPFLSVADDLNDREHDPTRDTGMDDDDLAEWVEDLFERIFETVSLMDVDMWRLRFARTLPAAQLRPAAIPGDGLVDNRAMGAFDALRDPDIAVPPRSDDIEPFPLTTRARSRHRQLSDLGQLAPWVLADPARLATLVRPPMATPSAAGLGPDMRMPPFMRASNAGPLSLARWQYDLLMAWAAAVVATGSDLGAPPGAPPPLSAEAAMRREQVLRAVDGEP